LLELSTTICNVLRIILRQFRKINAIIAWKVIIRESAALTLRAKWS